MDYSSWGSVKQPMLTAAQSALISYRKGMLQQFLFRIRTYYRKQDYCFIGLFHFCRRYEKRKSTTTYF
jgi:hypothetical protein